MVDSVDADLVEALPEVRNRILLVNVTVHREQIALLASGRKYVFELDWRIALLVGVKSDSDYQIAVVLSLLECLRSGLGGHVAKEAHDELGVDPESLAGIHLGTADAGNNRFEFDSSSRMGLRIKEHFYVHNVLRRNPCEVSHREVVEVFLAN